MMALERIPDQCGYLVLTEDGAVICSGGELENSEHTANVILGLITLTDSIGPDCGTYKKISVVYQDVSYVICLSNKKIYIVKKRYSVPKLPASNTGVLSSVSSGVPLSEAAVITVGSSSDLPENLPPSLNVNT